MLPPSFHVPGSDFVPTNTHGLGPPSRVAGHNKNQQPEVSLTQLYTVHGQEDTSFPAKLTIVAIGVSD